MISWEDVEKLSRMLARKILRSGFSPEILVAISRGGFPVGRILSDELGVNYLTSMKIEYYDAPGVRRDKPLLICPITENVQGKKVLVVDDVADTGESLALAKEHLLQKDAVVKTSTLHYKPWSRIVPDYFVKKVTGWIIYPWEKRETVEYLFSTLKREGKNKDEIIRKLKAIGFAESDLRPLKHRRDG